MKNIIILIIIGILFISCGGVFMEDHFSNLAKGHSLWNNPEWIFFDSFRIIGTYISANIQYRAESGDSWENPKTTFNRGYGDCDDVAIAFMNIVYLSMGIKMEMVLVDSDTLVRIKDDVDFNTIKEKNTAPQKIESPLNHAMVRYKGVLIDPLTGYCYKGIVQYSWSFDYVFDK